MIILTDDIKMRVETIDKLLNVLDKDEINVLFERNQIVAKLADAPPLARNIVATLIDDNNLAQMEIMRLRDETAMLKEDIKMLVRTLQQTLFSPLTSGDFHVLKSRHGVY